MKFTITALDGTTLYEQIIDGMNIGEVVTFLNRPQPEPPKQRKRRRDAGMPKAKKNTEVQAV